jgi:phosphopantothenoylcysteine decarboxylase
MNTRMWDSPVTRRHFRLLLEDHGAGAPPPPDWPLDDVATIFARHCPRIRVVPPQSKRLACGDVGMGALAEVEAIVRVIAEAPSWLVNS